VSSTCWPPISRPEPVRETFSTPETVPFWQLPYFIDMAERAGLTASGYRCNTRSYWRVRSCWRRWCCWPRLSVFGSSAWAVCRKWFWAGVASGFMLYIMSKLT